MISRRFPHQVGKKIAKGINNGTFCFVLRFRVFVNAPTPHRRDRVQGHSLEHVPPSASPFDAFFLCSSFSLTTPRLSMLTLIDLTLSNRT
jgi:hypothetical protein